MVAINKSSQTLKILPIQNFIFHLHKFPLLLQELNTFGNYFIHLNLMFLSSFLQAVLQIMEWPSSSSPPPKKKSYFNQDIFNWKLNFKCVATGMKGSHKTHKWVKFLGIHCAKKTITTTIKLDVAVCRDSNWVIWEK
jgi:hypothetical protein